MLVINAVVTIVCYFTKRTTTNYLIQQGVTEALCIISLVAPPSGFVWFYIWNYIFKVPDKPTTTSDY